MTTRLNEFIKWYNKPETGSPVLILHPTKNTFVAKISALKSAGLDTWIETGTGYRQISNADAFALFEYFNPKQ